MYGHTSDISSLCNYDFYEPVWYFELQEFPEDRRKMARWLGEAHGIGQAMCYWIIPDSGTPIVQSTVQPILRADKESETVKAELAALDAAIASKFINQPTDEEINSIIIPDYLQYNDADDDEFETPHFEPVNKEAEMPEADEFSHKEYDKYILAEVLLPKVDQLVLGKDVGRKRDANDNPIGVAHANPIFDTCLYQVQFP
jgi:hypothetical protein